MSRRSILLSTGALVAASFLALGSCGERAARPSGSAVAAALEAYRFNEAADRLWHFIWNLYCDWYLEFIKPVLADSTESRQTASWVLAQAVTMLHPVMPFLSEELNEKIFAGPDMLTSAAWPEPHKAARADTGIQLVIDAVSQLRTIARK